MPEKPPGAQPHLLIRDSAQTMGYTYPQSVRGPNATPPPRDRSRQAATLQAAIGNVRAGTAELVAQRSQAGIAPDLGFCVDFVLRAYDAKQLQNALGRLDRRPPGKKGRPIELLSIADIPNDDSGNPVLSGEEETAVTLVKATVFIPDGGLREFERLIRQYLDPKRDGNSGPRNQPLIDSIQSLRRSVFRSFWTDTSPFPSDGIPTRWEVWLRSGRTDEERDRIINDFSRLARSGGALVGQGLLKFPDRTVVFVAGYAEQLAASVELLDCVAELRLAKELASFFMDASSPSERAEWIADFLSTLTRPPDAAPAVCVLDSGLFHQHPLIGPGLVPDGVYAIHPEWGTEDEHEYSGHGTEMAGLALYGDLAEALGSPHPHRLEHRLESVKILPPPGFEAHRAELFGWVTREGVHTPEVQEPLRNRVFSMAVTATDTRDHGMPSSWSSEMDRLAFDAAFEIRRLFVVSAGNLNDAKKWHSSPDCNDLEGIHDPAQAWNVVTVGAFTEKCILSSYEFPGWPAPIANAGGLAPMSSTSVSFLKGAPIKPDIVMEGGNAVVPPASFSGEVSAGTTTDSLSLLTTKWPGHELAGATRNPLTTTGQTSAACAQAARLAAILMSRYSNYWPETIRALLIHSARWTDEMRRSVQCQSGNHAQNKLLLQRFGWGVPSLERASWSASNQLTLD